MPLIAGGLTLGYTLQVTAVDQRLAALIPANAGEAARVGVLAAATLALGTFFSNTAIASMLMPVATITAAGSDSLDLTSGALTVALVAPLSMALPVGTPPNAMAYVTVHQRICHGGWVRTAVGLMIGSVRHGTFLC